MSTEPIEHDPGCHSQVPFTPMSPASDRTPLVDREAARVSHEDYQIRMHLRAARQEVARGLGVLLLVALWRWGR